MFHKLCCYIFVCNQCHYIMRNYSVSIRRDVRFVHNIFNFVQHTVKDFLFFSNGLIFCRILKQLLRFFLNFITISELLTKSHNYGKNNRMRT